MAALPFESDDDRALFFSADDFGVAVTWTRAGIAQTPFNAIFARPSVLTMADGEADMIDRAATLLCRAADLPSGAAESDPIAVAGEATAYVCRTIEPDDTGMAKITLQIA